MCPILLYQFDQNKCFMFTFVLKLYTIFCRGKWGNKGHLWKMASGAKIVILIIVNRYFRDKVATND